MDFRAENFATLDSDNLLKDLKSVFVQEETERDAACSDFTVLLYCLILNDFTENFHVHMV